MLAGIYFDIYGRRFEILNRFIAKVLTDRISTDEQLRLLQGLKTSDFAKARAQLDTVGIDGLVEEFDAYLERTNVYPFSDDTILTIATMDALLQDPNYPDFAAAYRDWANRYPDGGYGGSFDRWRLDPDAKAYYSFGNGSAMRVAPIAYFCKTREIGFYGVFEYAGVSAEATHNHPEGLKGAIIVAEVMRYALGLRPHEEDSLQKLRDHYYGKNYYSLRPYEEYQAEHSFDATCQGSLPQTFAAFFSSDTVYDAGCRGVALGGDADTQGKIAADLAYAFYKHFPEHMETGGVGAAYAGDA